MDARSEIRASTVPFELNSSLEPQIALAQLAVKLEGDNTLTHFRSSVHEISTDKADALCRRIDECLSLAAEFLTL